MNRTEIVRWIQHFRIDVELGWLLDLPLLLGRSLRKYLVVGLVFEDSSHRLIFAKVVGKRVALARFQAEELQGQVAVAVDSVCLLYTSPSPRDGLLSRM